MKAYRDPKHLITSAVPSNIASEQDAVQQDAENRGHVPARGGPIQERWVTDIESTSFHALEIAPCWVENRYHSIRGTLCLFKYRSDGIPLSKATVNTGHVVMYWEEGNRDSYVRALERFRSTLINIFGVDVVGDRDMWSAGWDRR